MVAAANNIVRATLTVVILTGTFCSAYQQHRIGSLFNRDESNGRSILDDGNGPEDLLLDELVRHWKWANLQKNNKDEMQVEEIEGLTMPISNRDETSNPQVSSPRQHPFAYRPHEPGFDNNGVVRPEKMETPEPIEEAPLISPRIVGQKERIFEEFPPLEEPVNDGTREPVAHAITHMENGHHHHHHDSLADIYLTALVAGCTASAVAAILALGVCFYRWQRRAKSAQDVEYPAYGITGPGPSPSGKSSLKNSPTSSGGLVSGWGAKSPKLTAASGDKKLAHSAHMFHFQHQKQQVIAMESSHSGCERRGSNSGGESDEDNEEGDYTVYECPGLAPTGEMEVRNPLFEDNPTPASPALAKRQQTD